MNRTVAGHFSDTIQARTVVDDLERNGFSNNELSCLASAGSGRFSDLLMGSKVEAETLAGTAAGGASGLLLGLAALAVRGAGHMISAVPMSRVLADTTVGLSAGAILGALVSLGISQREAERWRHAVRKGGILVLVHANDANIALARSILADHGSTELTEREEGPVTEPDPSRH